MKQIDTYSILCNFTTISSSPSSMMSTFSPIRTSKSSVSDLIFECLASSPGDEGLLLDRGDGYFDYTDYLFESFMLLFA